MAWRMFGAMLAGCVFLPATSQAQPPSGCILNNYGFPYGPRVAPPWSYPGLGGGPFVGYAAPPPGYTGLLGLSIIPPGFWPNGLSLYGPPVPVYGPLPGVFGNSDLNQRWRNMLTPGLTPYGWIGPYAASPRPRRLSVSAWPIVEPLSPDLAPPVSATKVGGCLTVSVKVPQPYAEVLVDGKKTQQIGTDRTFVSPPLEAGQKYRYTVTARWLENGRVVEMSQDATGIAGEVVRVDFDAPPVIVTGKR